MKEMTFLERIGDKGQRYEIRAIQNDGEEVRIGWSDDPEGFARAVKLHPGLKGRRVIDREAAEAGGGNE